MPSNWEQLETILSQCSQRKFIVELSYNVSSPDYYPSWESKSRYIQNYVQSFLTSESYRSNYPMKVFKSLTRPSIQATDFIPGDFRKQRLQTEFDRWGHNTNPIINLPHAPTQHENLQTWSNVLRSNFESALVQREANKFYLDHVQKLIRLAQDYQNEIYFYLPTNLNETEAHMLSCVWPYLPEKNKLYTYKDIEYSRLLTEDYLFDEGHLNKKGSQLLTQIVIRQLQSMKVIGESIPQYVSTSGSTHSGSGTPIASTSILTE